MKAFIKKASKQKEIGSNSDK